MPVIIPKEHTATVVHKEELYPTVFHLQIKNDQSIPFTAGQYASFLIGPHRRPFSFVLVPGEDTIDFLIGYHPDGVTKAFIEPLKVGDQFKFLAPYGRFTIEETTQHPLLFIAGGTGIAPIHGIIKQLLQEKSTQSIKLYFANYDEDRLYFRHDFEAWAKANPNFSFIPCLSTPNEAWAGKKGLVTEIVPQEIPDLTPYKIYVCGSPGMVTATIAMLKAHQVPDTNIHFERFT